MLRPLKLNPGDTIGLIAPAGPITSDQLIKAIQNLESLDFKVRYNESILTKTGYLAGNDKLRVSELHNMFKDPQIKGIMCARGGYGTMRLLPLIDFQVVKDNPKIFIGFSDITGLINTFYQKAGLVCFHGPMGVSMFSEFTVSIFLKALTDIPFNNYLIKPGPSEIEEKLVEFNPITIVSGITEGILAGGNLSILASLIGTPFEVDMKGKIVFIEEIGEEPYRIDRLLTQLIYSGQLKKASGILLGNFKDCETLNEASRSFPLIEVLKEKLSNLGIPVAYGFPFGHVRDNATIPVGINARFDAEQAILELLEPTVII